MRSKSIALLTIAAAATLLAGCGALPEGGASVPSESASAAPTTQVVEAPYGSPAKVAERIGADGTALEVWSAAVPDGAAPTDVIGEPEDGNVWVSVRTAQWVAAEGRTSLDIAPVLRSTTDEQAVYEGVFGREEGLPMTPEQSYTFSWYFQVPEADADAASLVLCVNADGSCSVLDR